MKFWSTVILALWLPLCFAQQLEIIELKSTSAERVLPALRPLLEPGATLSGMNNQLFLRASPRNRQEIRQALAALDRPARQLLIRVANQRGGDDSARGAAASGQVVIGGKSNVEARVWDSRAVSRDNSNQAVRASEGSPAFINIGRSLPVPMRQIVIGPGGAVVGESVVYRDIGQGFYAVPQVSGNRVTLEISQQADSAVANQRGAIDTQRLNTTVSGQLGEWIELGGSGQQGGRQQSGAFQLSTREVAEQRSIWLKVEEVQ